MIKIGLALVALFISIFFTWAVYMAISFIPR